MRRFFHLLLLVALTGACRPPSPIQPQVEVGDGDAVDGGDSGDAAGDGDSIPGDSLGDGDGSIITPTTAAHLLGFGISFDGRASDGGDYWLDIRINDSAALLAGGANWQLWASTYSYVTTQLQAGEIPFALQNGDVLRVHGPSYTGATDAVKDDNNAGIWDVKTTVSFPINIKHGAIWIEDAAGNVLDVLVYETARNSGDWFSSSALEFLEANVAAGLWPSSGQSDAVYISDPDHNFIQLNEPLAQADDKNGWTLIGGAGVDYYHLARGKTGEALKAALHQTIRGHTVVDYADLTSIFTVTDAAPSDPNLVVQFYTGDLTASDFNREHIWAKSHGGFDAQSQDGYSDLHHMRPTRPDVNSARWHLDFDNGGALYSNTPCRIVTDVSWEPRDAVKGDVARMLFYMAVRYEGADSNMPDLELVEDIPSLLGVDGQPNNYQHMSTPRIGRLSTLLQWHITDPPDDWERSRNNIIYQQFQGNRNPFIDHPEWVFEIW